MGARAVHEAAGSLCLDASEPDPRRERLRSALEGGRSFGSLGADRLCPTAAQTPGTLTTLVWWWTLGWSKFRRFLADGGRWRP